MLRLAPIVLFAACGHAAAQTPVYVVGTLYKRHEEVKSYGLPELRRIMAAIDPDVLVLDVSPNELAERKVFPGKIEYTGVVFPFLDAGRHRVYAGEPAEPTFTEIVDATRNAHQSFEAGHPEAAAAFKQMSDGAYAALRHHWRSSAEVNDAVTEAAFAAKHALDGSLVGPVAADGWERWNQNVVEVVRRAVAENPGKRVLVLTGIENRYAVNARLRSLPEIQLVDMPRWLREHP